MEWRYGPGEYPDSLPSDRPTPKAEAIYAELLDRKLQFKNFERDIGSTLWLQLDVFVTSGALTRGEVETLRRDHDGAYSIPLAIRYIKSRNSLSITKWMRSKAGFWSYDWVDTSIGGARGRGTLGLFAILRDMGAACEGADLAAEHLWRRLIGANYNEGLRQELRRWYESNQQPSRREQVRQHHLKYGRPCHQERLFDWLDHIACQLRPYIEAGTPEAVLKLRRVEDEVAKERRKFQLDIA